MTKSGILAAFLLMAGVVGNPLESQEGSEDVGQFLASLSRVQHASTATSCSVTLTCDDGAQVSCSASSPDQCTVVHASGSTCGYVSCGSTTRYCQTYARQEPNGCCAGSGYVKQKWDQYQSCNGSSWIYTGFTCSGSCIEA